MVKLVLLAGLLVLIVILTASPPHHSVGRDTSPRRAGKTA